MGPQNGKRRKAIRRIVGHELRLVIETSRLQPGPADSSSTTSDVKSYLLDVNLASAAPLAQRFRLYGPLSSSPASRSSISFDAGANFGKQDEEAARATPDAEYWPKAAIRTQN